MQTDESFVIALHTEAIIQRYLQNMSLDIYLKNIYKISVISITVKKTYLKIHNV